MIRLAGWSVACFLVLLTRCNPSEPAKARDTEGTSTSATSQQDPATARMADHIAKAFAGVDPSKTVYFSNDARINLFQSQLQSPDPGVRMNAWSFYATELLNGGYTEQAINEFIPLIAEVRKYPNTEKAVLGLSRLLAVAYLRLGEQANCVTGRNHESCIVPISENAQFTMTKGSESAMQVCINTLNEFGNDEEMIWILNLAAMTIGRYPDGVPEKWRMPESTFHGGKDFPRFKDISHAVGIKGLSLAGGSCVEDFDNDGLLDVITSSWGKNDPLTFWKNDGRGGFENISQSMGLEGIHGGLNMIHGDINNDGLADIFVLRGAWLFGEGTIPNSMLLNKGNGHFIDITETAGLLSYAPTQTAVFADFNLDGWIDLFVGNESTSQAIYKNEFYLNKRDGTFMNVTDYIGFTTQGMIKGTAAGDINNDGWPDLYLSDYIGPNMLLLNKGLSAQGIPQFENIAMQAGVTEPFNSFPTWMFDFNNDGWQDIFVSGYGDGTLAVARDYVRNSFGKQLGGHPRVYKNNGNNTFTDVSKSMGMKDNIFTMGCNYGDIDTDGFLDFYLGTGNPEFSSTVPHRMFRNNGAKKFDDVTAAGGFGHIQKGHAVAFGDLDRDGDEDLFESLGGAFEGDVFEDILYENPIGQDKSWVVLQLKGTQSNQMAIGARVKVVVNTPQGRREVHRTVSTGGSFGSSSLQLEIGLGNATDIDHIEITWPVLARTKQTFSNIPINSYIKITEGNADFEVLEMKSMDFREIQ